MHGSRRHAHHHWAKPALTALFALAVVAGLAFAPAAEAAPARQLTAHKTAAIIRGRPDANGTALAGGGAGARQHVVMRHSSVPADASGALSTVLDETVHGGYTAAGTAMRNVGYGTINITGVPAGATVVSATLLWDILNDSDDPALAQGSFDGTAITGTEWASGATPCWSAVSSNFSYEADVTSLVTGNGGYSLTGFASGDTDGRDPWNVGSDAPMLEGASLVVVYQMASMPLANIQIGAGGTETDTGNEADAIMGGFTVTNPAAVTTTYIVADGQESGNSAGFDGSTLPGVGFPGADPQSVPGYSQGTLWDTVTTDVSSLVNIGDTSASMSVTGGTDCLVWVGQVLDVSSAPTAPCTQSVAFGAYLATAEDGSCLVENGSVYTDTGPVSLNGLLLSPVSGAVTIDTDPSNQQLSADDANVQLGKFTVYTGVIPTTDLTGSFKLETGNAATFGALTLGAGLDVDVSGTDGLTVTGKVSLPKGLDSGPEADLSVTLTAAQGLTKASISASGLDLHVGKVKVGLSGFSLGYDAVANSWAGSLTVSLPTPSQIEVGGSMTITSGRVTEFGVNVTSINKPLGPDGVFLQELAADIGLSPISITGSGEITAGPKIEGVSAISMDGSLEFLFADPVDIRLAASLALLKGTRFEKTLSQGQLNYFSNGLITVDGHASWSFGPEDLDASLSGWVAGTSAFSLSGSGAVKVGLWHLAGADGVVSSAGIAACGHPFTDKHISVGFGYRWGGSVQVMADSCGLGPYTVTRAASIRSAGPAAAVHMTLPSGLPVASFAITGRGGAAPTGTLISPNGKKLSVKPARQGAFTRSRPEYGLGVDSAKGVDYVAVAAPRGGTWTFTPAHGSAVTSVATAQGLPTPQISAKVSGKGLSRKLSWKIAHVPGERVTFLEQAKGVDKVIAPNLRAGSGHRAFTPADGRAGKRSIVAIVTQNGLTSETIKVASYIAPATSTVAVTVQHAGKARGVITITPGGHACRSVCSLAQLSGTVVTLKPVPAGGSVFSWTQGICTGSGTCTIKLTQVVAVVGRFSP
jgi:hypothetical protein